MLSRRGSARSSESRGTAKPGGELYLSSGRAAFVSFLGLMPFEAAPIDARGPHYASPTLMGGNFAKASSMRSNCSSVSTSGITPDTMRSDT